MIYNETIRNDGFIRNIIMKIQLRLFASLAGYLPDQKSGAFSCLMEIEEGTTIESLLKSLKIPPELPKIIFLNGVHAEEATVLREGDRLGVFPPLAGG
jgi:molybdopterin synthase sulfur carrier subunit